MKPGQHIVLTMLLRVAVPGAGVALVNLMLQWPVDRAFLMFLTSIPIMAIAAFLDWRQLRSGPARWAIVRTAAVIFLVPSFALLSGRGWGSVPFLVLLVVLVTVVNARLSTRLDSVSPG